MEGDEPDPGLTLRVSGKLIAVDNVVEIMDSLPITPTQWSKVGANFLTLILALTINLLGHKDITLGWVVAALFVHEFGHYIGMLITGRKTASFSIGIFGPLALGGEGLSAGRKAIVALSGSFVGWGTAALYYSISGFFEWPLNSPFITAVLFVSAINLVPVKPFDGYAVVEHLVFLRHPKIRLFYLITAAVVMLFVYIQSFYKHDHPFYAFFFMALCWAMFSGAKKADNMSDMVLRLRRDGGKDLESGRYRPETIKRMEFSLNLFEIQNDVDLAGLLREIWDQAWEVPASRLEIIIVLAMYAFVILGCMAMPVVKQIYLFIF